MAGSQEHIINFEVDENSIGQRIDVALSHLLPNISRSQIKKIIKNSGVLVAGSAVKASYVLDLGDLIEVRLTESKPIELEPVAFDLDILFEDECLVVINKPAGLVVHPGAGFHQVTVAQALLHHLNRKDLNNSTNLRPGIVHRLDKDTTGAMVCAKNTQVHEHLAKQFHDKTNERTYVALLDGHLPHETMSVESYLFRDPRNRLRFASKRVEEVESGLSGRIPDRYRWAKSEFTRVESYDQRVNLVEVKLHTGRTHQIRVHASSMGVPIIGDQLYHHTVQLPQTFPPHIQKLLVATKRQLLHAASLGFRHPVTGENLSFHAPLPDDFQAVLDQLRNHFQPN